MRNPDDVNSGMFVGFIVAQASNDKMTIEQCLKSTVILQSKKGEV